MEHMLTKMAQQLDSMDESSLDSLWEKYAEIVNKFEPTKRWESAVLILSFIQAKRWKNQLFNTQWAMRTKKDVIDFEGFGSNIDFVGILEGMNEPKPKKAQVLPFFKPNKDK